MGEGVGNVKKGYGLHMIGAASLAMLMLAGCAEDTPKDAPKTEQKAGETATVGGAREPGTVSVKDYKVSDYTTAEKAKFYETNAVMFGEEYNQKDDAYLIYMFSPLCSHCNAFYDTLVAYEKLDGAYPIYKMNVDIKENVGVWKQIQGTPTLVLFDKKNRKVSDPIVGEVPLNEIPLKK